MGQGTLLNSDLSQIDSTTNELTNPFEAVFVPDFNTAGSPYATFTIEVIDDALAGMTQGEFQEITVGSQQELGRCSIYRPSTGNVDITVNVGAVNHQPTLESSMPVTGFENDLLPITLEFNDIDGDAIVLYVTGLPERGTLFTSEVPRPACGALPNPEQEGALTETGSLVEADENGLFHLWYYPAADASGANFDRVLVKAFDRPVSQAGELLDSYPDQVVTIDIFHVNQPPTISLNGEIISGQENPTVLSTSRNNDGKLTKRMNVSVADSDARGLQIRVSVSTDRGFFRDLQQVLANAQVTVVSAPADNTAATFMCRVQRCNDVTQNLLIETGGSALVTIRANDT